jgi:hypothetical protein
MHRVQSMQAQLQLKHLTPAASFLYKPQSLDSPSCLDIKIKARSAERLIANKQELSTVEINFFTISTIIQIVTGNTDQYNISSCKLVNEKVLLGK